MKYIGVEQEEQNQDNHQTTPSNERERQRTGWRTSQSIWRASMSSAARDGYLARRRANYHDQRVRSHDTTSTGQTSNHGDSIQIPNRMRLSHIRQLARSNRSQVFHNGIEQNSANNGDNVVVNQGTSLRHQQIIHYCFSIKLITDIILYNRNLRKLSE